MNEGSNFHMDRFLHEPLAFNTVRSVKSTKMNLLIMKQLLHRPVVLRLLPTARRKGNTESNIFSPINCSRLRERTDVFSGEKSLPCILMHVHCIHV